METPKLVTCSRSSAAFRNERDYNSRFKPFVRRGKDRFRSLAILGRDLLLHGRRARGGSTMIQHTHELATAFGFDMQMASPVR